jgi:hypothetical protein
MKRKLYLKTLTEPGTKKRGAYNIIPKPVDKEPIALLFYKSKNMKSKVIRITAKEKFAERTSLAKCRQLLEADELEYTDEEVIIIRDFVHCLAKMIHDYHMRCQKGLHKSKVFDSIYNVQIKELPDTKE